MRIHQWWSVGGCVKAARAPPSTTARPSTLVQLGDTKRRAWDRRTRIATGLGGAVKPVTHRHGAADVIGGVLSARLWARLAERGGMQRRHAEASFLVVECALVFGLLLQQVAGPSLSVVCLSVCLSARLLPSYCEGCRALDDGVKLVEPTLVDSARATLDEGHTRCSVSKDSHGACGCGQGAPSTTSADPRLIDRPPSFVFLNSFPEQHTPSYCCKRGSVGK
ncbi:hypothetical protein BKA56DRAFT_607804 [Ilyonectria sp. MPI-CAGE-AT-0026]|nr:hypothetical protein BKA56DRAFT_607804 [Ilyonectria sp. MPI-CAGE-AT-0026]